MRDRAGGAGGMVVGMTLTPKQQSAFDDVMDAITMFGQVCLTLDRRSDRHNHHTHVANKLRALCAQIPDYEMKPLEPEFAKILHDNLFDICEPANLPDAPEPIGLEQAATNLVNAAHWSSHLHYSDREYKELQQATLTYADAVRAQNVDDDHIGEGHRIIDNCPICGASQCCIECCREDAAVQAEQEKGE